MSGATSKILEYLNYKSISKYKFYKDTGLSNGFLDKNRNIGSDKCEIISNHYPDLSMEWVISGRDNMIRKENEGKGTVFIDNNDNTSRFLLERVEELVIENKMLKEEIKALKTQKKYHNTIVPDIAAEPELIQNRATKNK
jgi:hypothetical protein